MERRIYIDRSFGLVRAAIIEDGSLVEMHHEQEKSKKLTETLFLGRVEQIRPSVGAAFVNIGEELNAFLPIEEGHSLRCGQMLIVQGAAKQATETKGLRVTERINLAGKWLVLVPGGQGVHISKKVKDGALRSELTEIAQAICPDGFGLIVRTASEDVTAEAMEEEAEQLLAKWRAIEQKAAALNKPGILDESVALELRIVRDYAGKELEAITVNDAECFKSLCDEQRDGRIAQNVKITRFEEKDQLLFDVFGIEPQIDKALKKRVWLPCGGYLIIDPCEALTVIDVNSGKMTLGKNTESNALAVNLEAADEIARQLRLRDVGGIVVIDFIDLLHAQHREAVIARMKEAVKPDKAAVKVEGISKLGLLELTRKRRNDSLHKTLKVNCTYCSGSALLLAPHEVAQRALRQVKRMVLSGQRGPFIVRCAPSAAAELAQIRCDLDARVYALPTTSKHAERFEIEQISETEALPKGAVSVKKD